MYCLPIPFLLLILFRSGLCASSSEEVGVVTNSSAAPVNTCEFGKCTRWRILLVPLLTDRGFARHMHLLKGIVRSMLSGCPWYFPDQVQLQLLVSKNDTFLPITDPIALPILDQMLDQLSFSESERNARRGQWKRTVELAVERMNNASQWAEGAERKEETNGTEVEEAEGKADEDEGKEDVGQFIFVITDFERSETGHDDDEFLEELDRMLAQSRINLRNVRLQFDRHKHTQIVAPGANRGPGPSNNVQEAISNISSHIVRVALIEQQDGFADAFAAIRPCPALSDAERIREYSFVQHFYYRNWFLKNPRGALIGLALFLFALLCAASAYVFHLWESRRAARRRALFERQQQQSVMAAGEGAKNAAGGETEASG